MSYKEGDACITFRRSDDGWEFAEQPNNPPLRVLPGDFRSYFLDDEWPGLEKDDGILSCMDISTIISAVWPDTTQEHGFGHRIIKGTEILQQCIADGRDSVAIPFGAWESIECRDEDQAIELEMSYAMRTCSRLRTYRRVQ